MKKCMIISDSFKGTISSKEITNIFEESFNEIYNGEELIKVPVSDGGEGFIEMISSFTNGEFIEVNTFNPYLENIKTNYYLSKDTAYIEVASSIGLPLIENRLNPMKTSSYGVGIMIKDAIEKGAKKIIIGLGGSSTNDLGVGIAHALYTKFYDKDNKEFLPTGGTLKDIKHIENSETFDFIKGISIIGLTDVKNPLYGNMGASHVFSKQKGANDSDVIFLEENIKYLSDLINDELKIDLKDIIGGGAAGGIGAGIVGFLNGTIKPGIDTNLDLINFDELLNDVDVVFTGEGKFDFQSMNGKVIDGILKRTSKMNVPVVIISGAIEKENECYSGRNGIASIFSINREAKDFNVSRFETRENYKYTISNVLRTIKLGEKIHNK